MCTSQYGTCSAQTLQQRTLSSTVITQRAKLSCKSSIMQNGCDSTRTACLYQNIRTASEKCQRMPQRACGSHGEQCGILKHFSLAITSILHDADLQLSFYRSLCYNSRANCPLLQYLRSTSAILADAHSYFVVSSFKCEGKIVAMT